MVKVDFLNPVDFLETRTMILVINSYMAQLLLQSAKGNQLELNDYVPTCYTVYGETLADCRLQTILIGLNSAPVSLNSAQVRLFTVSYR